MRRLKILGLGDNTVDTYVDLGRQYPGGNAVNVAVMTGRMGCSAAYMGCLGADTTGDFIVAALEQEGLDLSHCRRVDGGNARAYVSHNGGDRRFLRSTPGVRGAWGGFTRADKAYIADFDLVHSSIFSELETHAADLRSAIHRWSFDFSERWTDERFPALLNLLDYVFVSAPRASDVECEALVRRAAVRPDTVVVATRGARGSMALKTGRITTRAPAPTNIVDTLGAGDALIATFLKAELEGASLDDALTAGAQAAALACTVEGAFGHGAPWAGEDATIARTG